MSFVEEKALLSDINTAFSLPRKGRLDLISGGARSGKSRFAVNTALAAGQNRLFVATAQAWDHEMRSRIQLHQEERQNFFLTLDAPTHLHEHLQKQARCDVILIDCLTLWISNLMLADSSEAMIRTQVELGLKVALEKAPHVLIVSNEVGLGIVPDNALARAFRDINGRLQQDIAQCADEVYLAAMGVILPLKKLARLAAEADHA